MLLSNIPFWRIGIFAVGMFALSYGLTSIAIWRTESRTLRLRQQLGAEQRSLIHVVIMDSIPVWLIFVMIAFALTFFFLWSIGRFSLSLPVAVLWGLGITAGISLESFCEFRAPSRATFIFLRVNNLVDDLLEEAEKGKSSGVSAARALII